MPVTRCDIFCKVIDNFGDIGVCWRLARQLATEHGLAVRLWVDDLASFQRLVPSLDPRSDTQSLGGVAVCHWNLAFLPTEAADIVIEAFACDPPKAYIAAMVARPRPPAWINLEYLSAEAWVEGCHALPSPHPSLPLTRYFFFPGFTPHTGGLLREAALLDAQQAFRQSASAQNHFWEKLGQHAPDASALKVSIFSYENAAICSLLDIWAQGARPIFCAVPEGRIQPQIDAWAQARTSHVFTQANPQVQLGKLQLALLPFMQQDDYDCLLAACDINFVRGEDSFVRAQWAGQAFVWHIYHQADGAHLPKLDAFLSRYSSGLPTATAVTLERFWHAWEHEEDLAPHWPAMLEAVPILQAHTRAWTQKLATNGDLTSKLLIFCRDLLE